MAAVPGQIVNIQADGMGTSSPTGGTINGGQRFGNGGQASDGAGSGGGGSALYVSGNLVVVAGAGGGGSPTVRQLTTQYDTARGDGGGLKGQTLTVVYAVIPNNKLVTVNGGSPGTTSAPGSVGTVTANPTYFANGSAGSGRNCANGPRGPNGSTA
ncbi:hypothetical protein FOXG_08961 [Fusarium oxysporum f. sp. lycopersici 4287]|uniref:Uncharacterized protein n=1 Tax=Fusarium oxysporum f. sp. lycopersici (strain 4287 / CBS 123668 / FGSC 9935 / NRRL 34936) TaxID=426428 RepID=A0A0J9V9T6_FUSO4|nr:hypothetical protein FOXG_08961 [Fusarium oxysporum f. sp. lycopersici 4287]KNB07913.1 hypothetical protein FOXG_08961 [Fusarium oxysporum f. sp. lycopersici 4287]